MKHWNCQYCGTALFEGINHSCSGTRRAAQNIVVSEVLDLVVDISATLARAEIETGIAQESRVIWQRALDLKERSLKAVA